MTRPLGFWIGLLACLALPAFGLAQDDDDDSDENGLGIDNTGGLAVTLYINDKAVELQDPDPLGKRACDENWALEFEVTGFETGPSAAPLVALWYGDDCHLQSKRDAAEETDCKQVGDALDRDYSNLEQSFTIPMVEFCDLKGNINVYFLPVDSETSGDTVETYGVYTLEIDTSPPNAPTNVRAKPGETVIPVEWEPNDANIFQNWLVWDTAPIDAADLEGSDAGTAGVDGCGSGVLIAGEEFDVGSLPSGIQRRQVGDVSSETLDGTKLGVKRIALGVVSEDRAGNRSVMSNITCVSVVATDGFWDAYQNAGGDIEQGCACSLPGATPRESRLPFVPLALVAVAFFALRSRRKRRS